MRHPGIILDEVEAIKEDHCKNCAAHREINERYRREGKVDKTGKADTERTHQCLRHCQVGAYIKRLGQEYIDTIDIERKKRRIRRKARLKKKIKGR